MKAGFPILLLALCEPARTLRMGGLIARLKQEIPHARITLATTSASAGLFQDDQFVDELQVFDGALFRLKALGALNELSQRRWGLCIDIGPSLLSRMMKARTRFTYNPNAKGDALTQICSALRLTLADVAPDLRLSPGRIARVRSQIEGGKNSEPYIVMAPGASWLGRRWPTERFAVLAARLLRENGPLAKHRLLVMGGAADHETMLALSMATSKSQAFEVTGDQSLLNAYAALKNAALFVGNDEIWLHLAAAAGVPSFGLLGPGDERNIPDDAHVHLIRGPRSLADIRAIDPRLNQKACHMLDLSIDHVASKIERSLAGH
ncbi:MAG: glycosyltransferase family 9 protein [Asticcacaulis sp.]